MRFQNYLLFILLCVHTSLFAQPEHCVLNGYTLKYQTFQEKSDKSFPESSQSLFIYQNKKNVFSLKNWRVFYEPEAEKQCPQLLDFTGGNNPRHLIVGTFSGGAHFCNQYYVLELGPKFRVLQVIKDAANGGIALVQEKPGQPYSLRRADETFLYKWTCYAESPKPHVQLIFQNHRFVFDKEKMRLSLTAQDYQNALLKVRQGIRNSYKDSQHIPIINELFHFIYTGNAPLGWQLFDTLCRECNCCSGRYEEVVGGKKTSVNLKTSIKMALRRSPFYKSLCALNDNKLFSQ